MLPYVADCYELQLVLENISFSGGIVSPCSFCPLCVVSASQWMFKLDIARTTLSFYTELHLGQINLSLDERIGGNLFGEEMGDSSSGIC